MADTPTTVRQRDGAAAEDAALEHLQHLGMQLVARNVSYKFGEIDLILRDASSLVFVEVRFRRNSRFGGAAMSVDAPKRRKIARAAQAWLQSHRQFASGDCRFDVVAVCPVEGGLECQWLRSAFTMDDLW